MSETIPPLPESATLPRLVRDAIAAERRDQFWGFYGCLNRSERNALYIEALCAGPAPLRTPGEITHEYVKRLSFEEIP